MNFVLALATTTLVARGAPRSRFAMAAPYTSLDQEARLLIGPRVLKRLFRKGEAQTLRLLRERYAVALILDQYPFAAGYARELRERLDAWDVDDEIAVLTRAELAFAALLVKYPLNGRAKSFLATHRPRTLADLRAVNLDEIGNRDARAVTARAQLRAVVESCDEAFENGHQPRT